MQLPITDKMVLTKYLEGGHDALLWKLDGLSEYDVRRPLTPTGTNLLGLIKHIAFVEIGYFGEVFGRPNADLPYDEDDPNTDMYALAGESRDDVIGWFNTARARAIALVNELPLDTQGHVPWWGDNNPVTLHQVAVHMITDLQRHAGHADILRELIDGAVGLLPVHNNIPDMPPDYWPAHCAQLEQIASSVTS